MTQPLPDGEVETTGSSGKSAVHAAEVWLGSAVRHTGDSYQATGDGNNHTTDADTMVVEADTTTSALTVTVDSNTAQEGRILFVFDSGGNAGTNAITVSGGTGVTVNGTSNITTNNGAVLMISDGTDYWVVSNE